eukprot:873638-Pyramimonas_sp.AAC.1
MHMCIYTYFRIRIHTYVYIHPHTYALPGYACLCATPPPLVCLERERQVATHSWVKPWEQAVKDALKGVATAQKTLTTMMTGRLAFLGA